MKLLRFVILIASFAGFGQTTTNTSNETGPKPLSLPEVIPPSPTIAALLKFEEIPVSNYTGVPDIGIPLVNIQSSYPNVSVNLGLKYHPSGAQVNIVPGWTGAGWSLEGDSYVSRTVRDLPDDYYEETGDAIYRGMWNTVNGFESVFADPSIFSTYYEPGSDYNREKFLWEAFEKGYVDTQYDIYTFAIPGASGSFYIKSDGQTVKLFNANAVKIVYNKTDDNFVITRDDGVVFFFNDPELTKQYSATHTQYYGFNSVDDWILGKEKIFKSTYHLTTVKSPAGKDLIYYNYQTSTEITKDDSWVRNVGPQDGEVLGPVMGMYYNPLYPAPTYKSILPKFQTTSSYREMQTKKLSSIIVPGHGRVEFITESRGGFEPNSTSVRLKGIVHKDAYDNVLKNIRNEYFETGGDEKLFLNKVIVSGALPGSDYAYELEYEKNGLLEGEYPTRNDELDSWGYARKPSGILANEHTTDKLYSTTGVLRKMTLPTGGCYVFDFGPNTFSYAGQQYLGCTGELGCDGDSPEPGFIFDNEENFVWQTSSKNYFGLADANNSVKQYIHIDKSHQGKYKLTTSIPYDWQENASSPPWKFKLVPVTFSDPLANSVSAYTVDTARPAILMNGADCSEQTAVSCSFAINLQKGGYIVLFEEGFNISFPPISYNLEISYKKAIDNKEYLYGGGLRINNIGYFADGNASADYYKNILMGLGGVHGSGPINNNDVLADFETNFDYSFPNYPNRSSGSLSYPKPAYSYRIIDRPYVPNNDTFDGAAVFDYDVSGSENIYHITKTKGADVGYKHVQVTRRSHDAQELGYSRFTYQSPIDISDPMIGPIPNPNVLERDYRRGLLLKEEVFDSTDRILQSTENVYDYEEQKLLVGVRLHTEDPCFKSAFYNNFTVIFNHGQYGTWGASPGAVCSPGTNSPLPTIPWVWDEDDQELVPLFTCNCLHFDFKIFCCGYPSHYINMWPIEKVYGWAKLSSTVEKKYFYTGINTPPNQLTISTDYDYYAVNRRPKSIETTLDAGNVLKTDYYYPSNVTSALTIPGPAFSTASMTALNMMKANTQYRISEQIQTDVFRNGQLLSRQRTLYKDYGSNLVATEKVGVAKGSQDIEQRISFNRVDLNTGAIQEVQMEGGAKITYLYGYNKAYPVAKIDNMAYQDIPSNLITAIENATPVTIGSALDALRADASMANAMVTTLTYKPGVGVSTVTDPRGYTTRYIYDSFGRLSQVQDHDDNILSENEYHYGLPNWVKTKTYKVATTTSIANPTAEEAQINVTYLDGLGRPIEQIAGRMSGDGHDLITPISYDAYGRQTTEWLPLPSGQNDQAYVDPETVKTDAITFYDTAFTEPSPFGEKQLEASPLNRILKQAAPGTAWAMGSGHEIKFDYQTNAGDEVKYYKAVATYNVVKGYYEPSLSYEGHYGGGQLYKTVSYDENSAATPTESGGSTIEFKDKEGRVVLKRVWGRSSGDNNNVPHDTFYVYDQFGNLTYVIPPLASKGTTTISTFKLDGLCYQYAYDHRNRLVTKKLPGKHKEFIVYDPLDRVIATGPALHPEGAPDNGWLVTKYDFFGRPAYTGWLSQPSTDWEAARQAYLSLVDSGNLSERRSSAAAQGYTTDAYPTTGLEWLTIQYYDNYDYPNAPAIATAVEGEDVATNVRGLPTHL